MSHIAWYNSCHTSPGTIHVTHPLAQFLSHIPWYNSCHTSPGCVAGVGPTDPGGHGGEGGGAGAGQVRAPGEGSRRRLLDDEGETCPLYICSR